MRLATITCEGFPHLVHLCHFFDGENIYFATDYETKKIENIESNQERPLYSTSIGSHGAGLRE